MIFLTGATGTIGSATVQALSAKSVPFRIGSRRPLELPGNAVEFDWDRPATFAPALQGVTTAFLLTPVAEQMVPYSVSFLAAAKSAGVQRVVKLSVVGANSERGISFARLHGAAEDAVRASGLAWTMLRPTGFMQNFPLHYGVNPAADSTVFLPHGDATVSWIDALDVGAVAAETLINDQHTGKIYDLTGPETIGVSTVVSVLSAALGHAYSYVNVPEEAARHAMTEMGQPAWLVEGLLELHAMIRAGYLASATDTVATLLGRPAHDLAAFAARFAKERSTTAT